MAKSNDLAIHSAMLSLKLYFKESIDRKLAGQE